MNQLPLSRTLADVAFSCGSAAKELQTGRECTKKTVFAVKPVGVRAELGLFYRSAHEKQLDRSTDVKISGHQVLVKFPVTQVCMNNRIAF